MFEESYAKLSLLMSPSVVHTDLGQQTAALLGKEQTQQIWAHRGHSSPGLLRAGDDEAWSRNLEHPLHSFGSAAGAQGSRRRQPITRAPMD